MDMQDSILFNSNSLEVIFQIAEPGYGCWQASGRSLKIQKGTRVFAKLSQSIFMKRLGAKEGKKQGDRVFYLGRAKGPMVPICAERPQRVWANGGIDKYDLEIELELPFKELSYERDLKPYMTKNNIKFSRNGVTYIP